MTLLTSDVGVDDDSENCGTTWLKNHVGDDDESLMTLRTATTWLAGDDADSKFPANDDKSLSYYGLVHR